ncbi:MAG: hypothetical protein HDS95_02985 [Bacteroidales bacterium]|nr:hypothetical protein [Bacteroidales bacterium]
MSDNAAVDVPPVCPKIINNSQELGGRTVVRPYSVRIADCSLRFNSC